MSEDKRSRARDRQQRRRERQRMVRAPRRQISPPGAFKMPKISLPRNRLMYIVPVGIVLLVGVIIVLGSLKPTETDTFSNAIWLDDAWTYAERSDDEINQLATTLRNNRIGTVYAFVSALKPDGTWSGNVEGRNIFGEVERPVREFVQRLKQAYPEVQVYGWLDIRADLDEDGYRLDDFPVHQAIATFSSQIIGNLSLDGILLDVKPLWTDNDDLLLLLRTVRRGIGPDTTLAVTMAPDLTPEDAGLATLAQIASGTVWNKEYKQRVALQADQIVVTAYHSYRDNPLDYINWVTYQVDSYTEAIAEIETDAQLIISIPNYAEDLPAHDPAIESIPGALDGVNQALNRLAEDAPVLVAGVAIFTDRDLTDNDWALYRSKWFRN